MLEEVVEKGKGKIMATVLRTAATALVIVLMNTSASLQAQTVGAPTVSVTDTILIPNVLDLNLDNGLYPTAGKTKCDTQNNPQCCGGDTNICSTNGMATVTCASGICNGTCAAGRADCNGNKLTDGCENALNTVDNCGACGAVCPGRGQSTGDASCTDPSTGQCGFTCRGENYDVNNNAADGCERADATSGHTQALASSRGSKNNSDSLETFSQLIISDGRFHANPVIDGFNNTTGAAPDWWSVDATGGILAVNDYAVTFTTSGGSPASPCYTITIITNSKTQTCATSGSGSCTMNSGSGSYSDGTKVYFKIEKTCTSAIREAVTYSVQYHL